MWSSKVYYQEHKEELQRKAREKYWNNRDDRITYSRKYRKENPDKIRANNEKFRTNGIAQKSAKNWRDNNKDKISVYNKEYKKQHPEKRTESERKRRARKFGCQGNISSGLWIRILDFYGNKCLCCGSIENITQDHVVPLSKGGTHTFDNVQPLCGHCNSSKNSKTIDYRNGAIFNG